MGHLYQEQLQRRGCEGGLPGAATDLYLYFPGPNLDPDQSLVEAGN